MLNVKKIIINILVIKINEMFQGIEYLNDISLENIKQNLLLKIENISKQGITNIYNINFIEGNIKILIPRWSKVQQ